MGISLIPLFTEFRDQILVCPDFRGSRRESGPDFLDSNSRCDYAVWA